MQTQSNNAECNIARMTTDTQLSLRYIVCYVEKFRNRILKNMIAFHFQATKKSLPTNFRNKLEAIAKIS